MFVSIDRNHGKSIKKQLYDAITEKILDGELKVGVKMPSSRQLSVQLNIARNTVREIYDQLVAESYLKTVKGNGTYVIYSQEKYIKSFKSEFSICAPCRDEKKYINFVAGTPDLSEFPRKIWVNCTKKVLIDNESDLLDYNGTSGCIPLRKTLREYLLRHKGINCSYEQIIITNGTRGALSLIALFYKKRAENLIIESPAVNFATDIFTAHEYSIKPVKVDCKGMITDHLPVAKNSLIYVTPSHQFPIGGTLPVNRRLCLIKYAQENGNIILEDDYDSEYRYKGAPVNSLHRLSPENVIHIGTFSKTLAPSVRLGYMVVPAKITAEIKEFHASISEAPNAIVQMVMDQLIATGEYEKHIHKMGRIYKRKLNTLIKILSEEFNDEISLNGENSGLHISMEFKNDSFCKEDKNIFAKNGLVIDYDSDYMISPVNRTNTLILGFGHMSEEEIVEGIKRIKKTMEEIRAAGM